VAGETQEALVSATFSQRMRIRLADGSEVIGRLKGKKIRPVCGDFVTAQPIEDEPEWLITAIRPRSNELTRPDMRHRVEILAANISSIAIVAAAAPTPDWFMVDRYLAAAEFMGVSALVIFNKIDLAEKSRAATDELDEYSRIGYPVVRCSASTGANLDELHRLFRDQTAIIVGQSGVGKSTIINKLIRNADLQTAELSRSTGEGQHTTVNSVMLLLPDGGGVIDSPGVRDYAPAIDAPEQVAHGFREIDDLGPNCRFANCRHLREPDCAVKNAVQEGGVSPRRYESYRRLLALAQKLADDRNC
jgi:ribosome biogenesis GTPase